MTEEQYKDCSLCPRECQVDRTKGEKGFCDAESTMKIAYAGLHNGEEPPISGSDGSGTIFFSGCTMKCFFCQNWQISRNNMGTEVTPGELAEIFLILEKAGAANINLVSGTQYTPGILEAFRTARQKGLTLPGVWNSSGYDKLDTIKALAEEIKIWLPDIKTLDRDIEENLFKAPGYSHHVQETLLWLTENLSPRWEGEVLKEGIILRHLVLPGELQSTKETLTWYKKHLYPRVILSLMFQYTPLEENCRSKENWPALKRSIQDEEYWAVTGFMEDLGIEEGFVQALDQEDHTWSPDFTRTNPFSSQFSKPIWHQGKYV